MVKKRFVLLALLLGLTSVAVQAQPSADTASAFGTLPQEGTVAGPRFPRSATDALVELDLSSSEVIELDADEAEIGGGVSGLLGASRDVFASQVSYNLSPFRFNPRGYRSDYTSVYFNGFSFRDPETGYANYSVWGGLNDVLRNYTTEYSLAPSEFSFGNFAGTTTYSTRASNYRKQTSVSLAASNRTYTSRMMATYSSGLMDNGWAITASASARLASEGFMDGTPYEAYAYFLSVEKQLNKKHALNLTVFGAPLKRGMSSAVIQDVYDLRDYHYNPNWGFQDGEMRSARIRHTHMPVAMLNYFWNINDNSKFEAGVAVQTGRNGTSALDWFEGNDPRPDYYRKLPRYNSSMESGLSNNRYPNANVQDFMERSWQNNISKVTQIDWDALYQANYAANQGVDRANGWQAMNILKEYRNDQTTFSGYVNYRNYISKYLSAFGGVEAKQYKGSFFQTVLDPLGADYYMNQDKFLMSSVQDYNYNYNINEKTDEQRRKYKGDRYGYDYDIYQTEVSAWGEAQLKLNKFDFFVAGQLGYTDFWRDSRMKNGRVESLQPGRSYGESDKENFITWGAKANATYKITGRHFITANAGAQTRAPQFRNSYAQIRYADITLNDTMFTNKGISLQVENIYTADIAYQYRGPSLRLKAATFYTLAQNMSEIRTFYDENTEGDDGTPGALIEYITQNLDKRYTGVELGVSYKLTSTLTAELAATHGAYIYNSNPNVTKITDSDIKIETPEKAWVTGYALGGIPQTAFSASLNYRSPKYWWVALTGNLVGNTYVDMYLDRRTSSMLNSISLGTEAETGMAESEIKTAEADMKEKLLKQEKYPWAYTVDLACGASWRVNGGILGFSASASNITNNFFKTGGYEQTRVPIVNPDKPSVPNNSSEVHRKVDKGRALVDAFPAKYYYSFGFNFFAQVYYRF